MNEADQEDQANPVPRWLQVRFGQLWEQFRDKPFTYEQAHEVLDEAKEVVNVILSRLRKSGWLTVSFHEADFRKRDYRLKEPSIIFRNIREVEKENA